MSLCVQNEKYGKNIITMYTKIQKYKQNTQTQAALFPIRRALMCKKVVDGASAEEESCPVNQAEQIRDSLASAQISNAITLS